MKVKDKEAHNLHQKLENSLQTSKNLKENIRELKKDKTSSDKSLKSAEKIFKVTEDKLNEKIVILEKKLALQPELNTTIFSSNQAILLTHLDVIYLQNPDRTASTPHRPYTSPLTCTTLLAAPLQKSAPLQPRIPPQVPPKPP